MARLMQPVIRGLAVGLPLLLTVALLVWLVGLIESWAARPLRWVFQDAYLPGMGLLMGVVVIILLGWAASTWLGGKLLELAGRAVERVPLLKTVYGALRDALGMFGGAGDERFAGAVVVEWGGQRFLGFITRDHAQGLPEGLMGEDDVVVYLPMGYQVGGFPVIAPRDRVQHIDMSVDAALKFAITAGAASRSRPE